MRYVEDVSDHEMVAHFLKTELYSARFGDTLLELLRRYGTSRMLLDSPDLSSPDENACRAALLGEYRGYRRGKGVFKYVPEDVSWHRYALDRQELARVRYIDYSYWIEISGGTRR